MTPQLMDIQYDITINLANSNSDNLRLIIRWLHTYRRDMLTVFVGYLNNRELEFKQHADYIIAIAECAYKKVLEQEFK